MLLAFNRGNIFYPTLIFSCIFLNIVCYKLGPEQGIYGTFFVKYSFLELAKM